MSSQKYKYTEENGRSDGMGDEASYKSLYLLLFCPGVKESQKGIYKTREKKGLICLHRLIEQKYAQYDELFIPGLFEMLLKKPQSQYGDKETVHEVQGITVYQAVPYVDL